ncbi:MAG TPA: hypothetical protein ENN03_05710 [bacterium]|nr:hypothetical protein [bacterium]
MRLATAICWIMLCVQLAWTHPGRPDSTGESKGFGLNPRLWWEFYDESMFFQRLDDNFISSSHTRAGVRVYGLPGITLTGYFMLRYGRDIQRDYWNNRAEGGVGFRLRFFSKVFLALYGEYIQGRYLKIPEGYPQASDDNYSDFRGGLIFWYGWMPYGDGKIFAFPLKSWGDIYSDVTYFGSQRNNLIGYAHVKTGLQLLRFWKVSLDGYGVIYMAKDVNKDFWNNRVEIGPGVWVRPWTGLELKFYAEWLFGWYFGLEGEDPNPYGQKYRDRRIGVLFWLGI